MLRWWRRWSKNRSVRYRLNLRDVIGVVNEYWTRATSIRQQQPKTTITTIATAVAQATAWYEIRRQHNANEVSEMRRIEYYARIRYFPRDWFSSCHYGRANEICSCWNDMTWHLCGFFFVVSQFNSRIRYKILI